ncbi:MAG: methylmalonyl-CoA mutase family protein [Planctomycetes bacterium]|nr:methylmalonyl-CoA mutase family protein [Planctomycetota bacterium]
MLKADSITDAAARWEAETVAPVLAKAPERANLVTASNVPIERLYTPSEAEAGDYAEKLGFPGQYPFTRGVQPTMYRGRLWTMRQYAGFATADESNRRYRFLLEQGSTGLSVAFDLPTQIGYDSDDPEACGEVGRVGVAIDSLADMEALFDGIPLDKVSTSMTINATSAILLAMYVAVGEKQGVPAAKLTGTLQNDILKEYIARGTYRFPPRPSLRLTSDIFAYCTRHLPKFNTISISGYHIREAGSTAAQEVGFTLADAVCYVETALRAGLAVDDFAPRLAFFFAAHTDLFEEAAKFRAARRLYARIMRERFGAQDPRSWMLRFHTQTGGVTLTAQQPENNVVRVALQALAAVLGGTQSLHTNGKDEALALPTEAAAQLALRTQQIIACESGAASTIDPLGGSYYVEQLTDRIEREAEAYIRAIDERGGMVAAIEQGYPQREIEHSAYAFNREIDEGRRQVVGVNCFTGDAPADVPLFRVDEAATARQVERVRALRASRDDAAVRNSLSEIAAVARAGDNLLPSILTAVKAYATVGEICRVLAGEFGEYCEAFHSA